MDTFLPGAAGVVAGAGAGAEVVAVEGLGTGAAEVVGAGAGAVVGVGAVQALAKARATSTEMRQIPISTVDNPLFFINPPSYIYSFQFYVSDNYITTTPFHIRSELERLLFFPGFPTELLGNLHGTVLDIVS